MEKNRYLPAEWHKQGLVQLTWPHKNSDWAYMLDEVEACFLNIACEVLKRQQLLVVTPEPEAVKQRIAAHGGDIDRLLIAALPTNDTWARDHAFITMLDKDNLPHLLDFQFNGWGMKFAANLDNQINRLLYHEAGIEWKAAYEGHTDFVLEGGSIESDGEGTLLTTAYCLTGAPNRNNHLNREEIESHLKEVFHLKQILWLHHGALKGDDTDGHIDTLARLCPNDTITYVQCTDPQDEHSEGLTAMEKELQTFRTLKGEPYRLLPLPLPDAIYDENGERLPATHANFLILNEAVLVPTYAQPEKDEQALKTLAKAFPGREIVGIDCRPLIRQHGSLHCVTMQYPEGVI